MEKEEELIINKIIRCSCCDILFNRDEIIYCETCIKKRYKTKKKYGSGLVCKNCAKHNNNSFLKDYNLIKNENNENQFNINNLKKTKRNIEDFRHSICYKCGFSICYRFCGAYFSRYLKYNEILNEYECINNCEIKEDFKLNFLDFKQENVIIKTKPIQKPFFSYQHMVFFESLKKEMNNNKDLIVDANKKIKIFKELYETINEIEKFPLNYEQNKKINKFFEKYI